MPLFLKEEWLLGGFTFNRYNINFPRSTTLIHKICVYVIKNCLDVYKLVFDNIHPGQVIRELQSAEPTTVFPLEAYQQHFNLNIYLLSKSLFVLLPKIQKLWWKLEYPEGYDRESIGPILILLHA